MSKWQFTIKRPIDKSRNSSADKFFSSQPEVEALVRESIQNSLDARVDSKSPVKVRFYIGNGDTKLNASQTAEWLTEDIWEHYSASLNGLRDIPKEISSCSFLTYEDFNTTGLTGDINQSSEVEGINNPFYYFFRAENQSGKAFETGATLGTHGLGKVSFLMSSNVKTLFALTNRNTDNKSYLAGISTLKFHKVNDIDFQPDGWFGEFGSNPDDVPLPIDQDENDYIFDRFKTTFHLSRSSEIGTSMVIPMLHENIQYDALKINIIQEYFAAIMDKSLIVEICDNDDNPGCILDFNNLIPELEKIDEDDFNDVVRLRSNIELATEYFLTLTNDQELDGSQVIKLSLYEGSPQWSSNLLPETVITKMTSVLANNESIFVRVPVLINDDIPSYFDIAIKKFEEANNRNTLFIRNNNIIKKANDRIKISGYVTQVYIHHSPLSEFLGLAEDPSHQNWSEFQPGFKEDGGKYAPSLLRFVKNCCNSIIKLIQKEDTDFDLYTLADYFNVNSESYTDLRGKEEEDDGENKEEEDEEIDDRNKKKKKKRKKTYFQPYSEITPTESGFNVSGIDTLIDKRKFSLAAAYDSESTSDPFNLHKPFDFELKDLIVSQSGVSNLEYVINSKGEIMTNKIRFDSDNQDFLIEFEGFDTNRDLLTNLTSRSSQS